MWNRQGNYFGQAPRRNLGPPSRAKREPHDPCEPRRALRFSQGRPLGRPCPLIGKAWVPRPGRRARPYGPRKTRRVLDVRTPVPTIPGSVGAPIFRSLLLVGCTLTTKDSLSLCECSGVGPIGGWGQDGMPSEASAWDGGYYRTTIGIFTPLNPGNMMLNIAAQ